MTPIDRKINRKVAVLTAAGLAYAAIAAGFAYYSETGPFLHRALDNFGPTPSESAYPIERRQRPM